MSIELAVFSARIAENAKFDAIFFADKMLNDETGLNPDVGSYEPTTTLGALSALTTRIGLIATVSTTFSQPYANAKVFTQLDHLSKGRVGWNVVTSGQGEQNLTGVMPPKTDRYEAADDYLKASYALWDAWDDDAVVADRERGMWADPNKIHAPHYQGPIYRVTDALLMPPGPQRRPVIVQAGQSPQGMDFAARHAELIYAAKTTMDLALSFYSDIKGRAERFGRSRSSVKVAPGLVPIVGTTEAEAEEIVNELADLYQLEVGMSELSHRLLDIDLSDLALDDRIPVERLVPLEVATESPAFRASRYPNFHQLIVGEKPTIRELLRRHIKPDAHHTLVGTADEIATEMQRWFEAGACDGFLIVPPYMPEGLERFCDEVVPLLQERGLFRTEYPGTTLRDTLGLKLPPLPSQRALAGVTVS